jgi:hypothetical protein
MIESHTFLLSLERMEREREISVHKGPREGKRGWERMEEREREEGEEGFFVF